MLEEKVEEVSALLKSIAHPLRLRILCLLQDQELTVGEIREVVQSTDANVSQHLTIMRNQGIIVTRKDANFIYNWIADKRVVELINTMQNLFC
jgi:ArsR family transcriptional regulator